MVQMIIQPQIDSWIGIAIFIFIFWIITMWRLSCRIEEVKKLKIKIKGLDEKLKIIKRVKK